MELRSVRDANVKGKRVLVRVDFNVPIRDGRVDDRLRIEAAIPTIRLLLDRRARVILVSHRGEPKKPDRGFSLEPIVAELRRLLKGVDVRFAAVVVDDKKAETEVERLPAGSVFLFENLRFCPGEVKNDPSFSRTLAKLGDVFVNDAFGAAHRGHASTVGVTKFLPSYAGLLLEREVATLSRVLDEPKRPFVGIIGGAKISTKLKVIKSLLKRCDYVLLGGALANTILKAQGISVGKSLVEESMVEEARRLTLLDNRLRVPVDVVAATRADERAPTETVAVANVQDDHRILDIGPDTLDLYTMIIKTARLVVWNGPMGVFELQRFAVGTKAIARALAESKAETVAGGGETVEAIDAMRLRDRMSFVSTGGGAMLAFLEGAILPALTPLVVSS